MGKTERDSELDPQKIAAHFGTTTWCRQYRGFYEVTLAPLSPMVAKLELWEMVIAHINEERKIEALTLSIIRELRQIEVDRLRVPSDFEPSVPLTSGTVLPETDLLTLAKRYQIFGSDFIRISGVDTVLFVSKDEDGSRQNSISFYKLSDGSLSRLRVNKDTTFGFIDPFHGRYPQYIAAALGKRVGHHPGKIQELGQLPLDSPQIPYNLILEDPDLF